MKSCRLLAACILLLAAFRPSDHFEFIDPTGTYILKGDVQKNKIVGHSGEIRVKLVSHNHIAIAFYISKGYPKYESFAFVDTLVYDENVARYIPAGHEGCSLIFCFSYHDAELEQTYTNPEVSCGFGDGVIISTSFAKKSTEQPVIQDLSYHGSGV